MEALAGQAPAYPSPAPHQIYRGHEAHAALFATLAAAAGEPARSYRPVAADAIIDA